MPRVIATRGILQLKKLMNKNKLLYSASDWSTWSSTNPTLTFTTCTTMLPSSEISAPVVRTVMMASPSRYDECYRQLPEQFKAKHVMEIFGCSQPTASRNISRLKADGIIEDIGDHTYRKLLPELP